MTRTFLLVALGVVGCSFTSTVEVGVPRTSETTGARIASMHMLGAELLGIDEDALTSRAALVRNDDEATCVDMLLRHPGTPMGPTDLFVEVDDLEALTFRSALVPCAPGRACLLNDSPLLPYVAEPDDRVSVEAGRMCFAKLPRAHREIVLGRRGLFAWRFRFLTFTPASGSPPP